MRVRSMDAFVAPPYRRGNVTYEAEQVQHKTAIQRGKSGFQQEIKSVISTFEKDDYILIALLAVLIFEGCDDYVLLAALGYLFVMGLV